MENKNWFERAKKVIPGGVNSPVRAFDAVGCDPPFITYGQGAMLYDVEGKAYIDYIQSWGPMIFGHASELVTQGFEDVLRRGTSYGVPTPLEVEMAECIVSINPTIDMIRMVNSGTEATMSALRLARGYTRRNVILKFEGCYHGHSDALLVKSGSGTLTYGVPTSLGVPEDVVKDTVVLPYNDSDAVKAFVQAKGHELAAIIVEPIAGNMGVVEATQDFIETLRASCDQSGALLIFDEVITGFRIGLQGAYGYFGVAADLTCYGKIIGGGLPVGAYGGKREVMSHISPLGGVYQAGTLSGNPLAMHMGLKTLTYLKDHPETYDLIEAKAIRLTQGLQTLITSKGYPLSVTRVKGMVCLFFTALKPTTYADVLTCDTHMYGLFFRALIERGILFPPAQFEGLFLSTAHTDDMINQTLVAIEEALIMCYGK